jgi:proline dehydrogenase
VSRLNKATKKTLHSASRAASQGVTPFSQKQVGKLRKQLRTPGVSNLERKLTKKVVSGSGKPKATKQIIMTQRKRTKNLASGSGGPHPNVGGSHKKGY